MPLVDDSVVLFWHDPGVLLAEDRTSFVPNGTGHFYPTLADAQAHTNEVVCYNAAGSILTQLTSNYRGEILPFQATLAHGFVNFGSAIQEVLALRDLANQMQQAMATIATYEARVAALEAGGAGVGTSAISDTFTDTFDDIF